jgi:ATP-dependent RNA helicase RhlE
MIAADGFDFSKPYESATGTTPAAQSTTAKPATPTKRPGKMVAALLGGIKKNQP